MKRVSVSKPVIQENDEEREHHEGEKKFKDKQCTVVSSESKKHPLLDEKVRSEGMGNGRIPMDCHKKKLELQLTSPSVYLQACMVQ